MSGTSSYRLGADIPEEETLRDSVGRVVDDAYVDDAVTDALATVRRKGRPSLSETGESPLLRVRVSRKLDEAVRRAAGAVGQSRSQWVRRVLDDAVRRTR